MPSWVIGNSKDCDVVVDSPLASSRHCELTESPDGFLLNDLGSTNGTFVNGVRIAGPTRLARGDSITLGRTVPFPWPPELTTTIQIGRLPDNDIVLDDARVSGHHARLIVVAGFQTMIDDLGSSNGTFLNSPDRRVTGPTPVTDSDTLYFGTLAVPAIRLLSVPSKADTPAVTAPPSAVAVHEPAPGPIPTSVTTFVAKHCWHLVWLAQAPVLAVAIVLLCCRLPAAGNWQSVGQGLAATTFALALAAIWLGGSLAVVESSDRQSRLDQPSFDLATFFRSFGQRLAVLSALCCLAAVVLMTIVSLGAGLKGPWPAMWGVLTMASLVSLFLGLAMSVPIRKWTITAAILLIGFVAMTALGGWFQPLPDMTLPVRLAASAMPSRWAFEGLFLLESAQHQSPETSDESPATEHHDLVAAYFPAESERMGTRADAMALASMLIGLAALTLFISTPSRFDP